MNLNDDDVVSLGAPVAPQHLLRQDRDSAHIPGTVYMEREKLRNIGWQFKYHTFTSQEDAMRGVIGQVTNRAWDAIARSKAHVHTVRAAMYVNPASRRYHFSSL